MVTWQLYIYIFKLYLDEAICLQCCASSLLKETTGLDAFSDGFNYRTLQ